MTKAEEEEDEEEGDELSREETKTFRGMAALLNFYSQDCPDTQFPAKEISRDMAKPRLRSWVKVKRTARYLVGRDSVVWKFGWQEEEQRMKVFTDSDWGGSREERKSTSGGVIMWGSHCWKTWSSTQGAVALSSAEAEFYAMIDGTQRGKWAKTVAREIGVEVGDQEMILGTDSSAAKSFVARRGLGKMRHIEVRDLWLQEEVRKGGVKVVKVDGEENPADLMTKYLHEKEIRSRLEGMGMLWVGRGNGGSGGERGA